MACKTCIAATTAHVTTAADVAWVATGVQNDVHVTHGKLAVSGRVGMYPADVSLEVRWGRVGWGGLHGPF